MCRRRLLLTLLLLLVGATGLTYIAKNRKAIVASILCTIKSRDIRKTVTLELDSILGDILRYYKQSGKLPGAGFIDQSNAFPSLFECIYRDGFTFIGFDEYRIAVFEGDVFRMADKKELNDTNVLKYCLDCYGFPYRYRIENESSSQVRLLVYSVGMDGVDQTVTNSCGDDIVASMSFDK